MTESSKDLFRPPRPDMIGSLGECCRSCLVELCVLMQCSVQFQSSKLADGALEQF
jgi:hypothetical protein